MIRSAHIFALALCLVCCVHAGYNTTFNPRGNRPVGAIPELDCLARNFSWKYAQLSQPWRKDNLKVVFDALELKTLCNITYTLKELSNRLPPRANITKTVRSFHVDPNRGSDNNKNGTLTQPFRTIAHAIQVAVANATIYLHNGTHYLQNTIHLNRTNSGLNFVNYENATATISGGIPLKTSWKKYGTVGNIYVASLTGQNIKDILGLQIDGVRAQRARYPDGNAETTLFPSGWFSNAQNWHSPRSYPKPITNTTATPVRATGKQFQQYTVGHGGPCSIFTPPESYWCSNNIAGGGASIFQVPSGLTFGAGLFKKAWQNPVGGIVHAFHPGHWENWMFEISSFTNATRNITWEYGGFQGARGSWQGGAWFVENIFEELDHPNEFFYDKGNQLLYYYYNATGAPDKNLFEATNLKVFFNISGNQSSPVERITFQGIRFTNAAYTYMDPHGVPSGGDWSIQRQGALFFQGVVNVTIDNCLFTRLDAIAIFLNDYTRNVHILNSEFVWLGDSAIAAWGNTNGVNGTAGNFPRYTILDSNIFHEFGHYKKEVAAYFQARSAQTIIRNNIIFNSPRAGINFNDGFGGGNQVYENLMFNHVRETGDHGPFNSWDRQPFWTDVATPGKPSFNPAYNDIHHNMFLCNYNSEACIDNDDGSTFFLNHDNFEMYGCHKDYDSGHNKYTYDTVQVHPVCWGYQCGFSTEFVSGYVDGYTDNICVQNSKNAAYFHILDVNPAYIDETKLPEMSGNKIYNPTGTLLIRVGNSWINEDDWNALGHDLGTKAYPLPSNQEIIQMGIDALDL